MRLRNNLNHISISIVSVTVSLKQNKKSYEKLMAHQHLYIEKKKRNWNANRIWQTQSFVSKSTERNKLCTLFTSASQWRNKTIPPTGRFHAFIRTLCALRFRLLPSKASQTGDTLSETLCSWKYAS